MTTFLGSTQSSACSPKQDCDKKYFLNIAEIFRIKKGLARGMVDMRKKYPKLKGTQHTASDIQNNHNCNPVKSPLYRISKTYHHLF